MTSNFDLDLFLTKSVKTKASDIHLIQGEHPAIRKNGKIIKIDMPKLTEEDMLAIFHKTFPNNLDPKTIKDLDFAYEIKNISRFRVNLSKNMNHLSFTFRIIPHQVPQLSSLNLPKSIQKLANYNNGIIFVTGATGSGKSTTLASLLDFINTYYNKHIITVEDPIEFIFTGKQSLISQRELGTDTETFGTGLKYALRQDPDIIFIGEIRDKETMETALTAAETGHLIFSTLHTNNAVQSINRVVNLFDTKDRDLIRNQLAQNLRGTISQKLIPTADERTRIPACEILINTPTIQDFISKNELDEIYNLIKNGSFNDMITMNMYLHQLVKENLITSDVALNYSDDKIELQQMLKGVLRGANSYE